MAKWRKTIVGNILKSKEPGGSNYIKVDNDVVLKKGTFLNLENEAFQLKNLQEGVSAGRVGTELETKLQESIRKTPFIRKNGEDSTGFIIYQIVKLEKTEE